jgi:hypothetical protein
LYLAMEEWFHDANNKNEVRAARVEIANVLQMLQQLFPRPSKTNGYNILKMHGITKIQLFIKLFGSGINFYGGPMNRHISSSLIFLVNGHNEGPESLQSKQHFNTITCW